MTNTIVTVAPPTNPGVAIRLRLNREAPVELSPDLALIAAWRVVPVSDAEPSA